MGWKFLFVVHSFVAQLVHCSMDLSGKIYRTDAALEKENLMFCYECNTMVNGKSCSNFTDKDEYSKFSTKCTGDRKTCMVKRYSYTTSNESATSDQQLWSLERNCSGKCEDGCIVIGERNKIYACQACCETPLCNVSNGSDRPGAASPPSVLWLAFLLLLLANATTTGTETPSNSPSRARQTTKTIIRRTSNRTPAARGCVIFFQIKSSVHG